jgi:hypothetical protein
MPWAPGLHPVKAEVHAQSVMGGQVDRRGALKPSFIRRETAGRRPASISGSMTSNVAESHPRTMTRGANVTGW